jgi:CubicO group peptidase (beta-lactamase class C family)
VTGSRDASSQERRDAVAHGLLPIMRIADQPLRWDVHERLAHHGCPAVSIAVMRGGEIDWAEGFGRHSADADRRVGTDTVFMVASCSKPVTAIDTAGQPWWASRSCTSQRSG